MLPVPALGLVLGVPCVQAIAPRPPRFVMTVAMPSCKIVLGSWVVGSSNQIGCTCLFVLWPTTVLSSWYGLLQFGVQRHANRIPSTTRLPVGVLAGIVSRFPNPTHHSGHNGLGDYFEPSTSGRVQPFQTPLRRCQRLRCGILGLRVARSPDLLRYALQLLMAVVL